MRELAQWISGKVHSNRGNSRCKGPKEGCAWCVEEESGGLEQGESEGKKEDDVIQVGG